MESIVCIRLIKTVTDGDIQTAPQMQSTLSGVSQMAHIWRIETDGCE